MLASERSPPPSSPSPTERERKTSTKMKKPPPLKKRHTKPCKFYQFGRCPHTAEECNFAHVSIMPGLSTSPMLTVSPGVGLGGLCKHYLVGQCTSERVCGLRHGHPGESLRRTASLIVLDVYHITPDINALGAQLGSLQMSPASSLSPTTPYTGDFGYPSPYGAYPPYYHQTWLSSPYNEHSGTRFITSGGHVSSGPVIKDPGAESPSISTSISTEGSAASHLDTPVIEGGLLAGSLGLGRVNKHGEDDNQVHDYDDIDAGVVVTEDPQFAEHAHNAHQSQVRVLDMDHAPPGVGLGFGGHGGPGYLPPPPLWEAGGAHYYSPGGYSVGDQKSAVAPRTNPPTRSSSRASSRSKSTRYKTKPCKFYTVEKGCPSGDGCTFIHDASIPPVPPIIRSHSKSPKLCGSSDSRVRSPTTSADKDDEKSKKSGSQDDDEAGDNKEKSFFPITWRVIGGGVLIGGKRVAGSVENDLHGSQEGGSISLETGASDSTDSGRRVFSKLGASATRPRSRSTSAPLRRPGRGIGNGNGNLFSAESP
ncbi:hypothetical protein P691DRAFT_204661 [Macrolepiota fuliginosa MF-IS2]|uniref:C3H1-type domain-containing protein n=1 Tax=Macrolepiota fuliginosa MF-IS2 TaxID=1400762 RepID=A0A9P5XT05_9AGAR|nr:hypothetical protein P691DRAFT_204661 [Macrolepiota fuliginosa MF-IS2]